jgi:glutamyl-tRNA reductase
MHSHELTQYLYVHYEDRAVSHLLAVAAGLDSMVVGEDQILGQVRSAVKLAAEHGTAGRVLGELGRLALRTGKRARAETAIGRAGFSLLSAAVELAAARLGPSRPGADPLAGRDVLVVGAGSMSGLATATAARSGAASITVANRTRKHAERLAASVSTVTTTVTGLADLPAAIAAADVVISCTGAAGQVITGDMMSAALAAREAEADRGALVIMDLAMPRDVEPAVAALPGVVLIGMDQLSEHAGAVRDDDVAAVRTILEAELAAYQSAMDAARVAPTVVALRAKAAGVVDAELARLAGRLSADDLSGHALDEIAQTVRRVVDKLLHAPTVRVKELAGSPGGEEYAAALRVLFDLDPRAVEAVTRAAPEQEGSR